MAVLTHSLETQISKTRFPGDLSLTGYDPAETRATPAIVALAWDRPAKLESGYLRQKQSICLPYALRSDREIQ